MVDECVVCGSVKDVKPYYICLWDFGKRVCKSRPVCARCVKEDKDFKIEKQKEEVERQNKKLDSLKRGWY